MLKLPREQYEPLYRAILARLDPHRVADDLHRLADPHEPVLLCWERPPFSGSVWCHRQMVAAWLFGALGVEVAELEAAETRRCVAPSEDNVTFGDFPPRWAAPGVSDQRLNSKLLFFKKLFCYPRLPAALRDNGDSGPSGPPRPGPRTQKFRDRGRPARLGHAPVAR